MIEKIDGKMCVEISLNSGYSRISSNICNLISSTIFPSDLTWVSKTILQNRSLWISLIRVVVLNLLLNSVPNCIVQFYSHQIRCLNLFQFCSDKKSIFLVNSISSNEILVLRNKTRGSYGFENILFNLWSSIGKTIWRNLILKLKRFGYKQKCGANCSNFLHTHTNHPFQIRAQIYNDSKL